MSDTENFWRRCSSCKNPLGFGAKHYVCSVSTCNNPRTGYVFCSVACFERHLPGARHRDAAAVEAVAPRTAGEVTPADRPPQRLVVKDASGSGTVSARPASGTNREVLVIASRFKDYIQERSGFNTSGGVMDVVSDHLRAIADRAIDAARADGRKTVMDRDFAFLKNRP